jgi:hypothetical protein
MIAFNRPQQVFFSTCEVWMIRETLEGSSLQTLKVQAFTAKTLKKRTDAS